MRRASGRKGILISGSRSFPDMRSGLLRRFSPGQCRIHRLLSCFVQMKEKPVADQKKDETILLEFSMSPLTKGESVGEYVARSLEIIEKSGLDYRLNPKGTVIEGPRDEVLGVVRACWERMKED